MKKIFTLLVSFVIVASAFAQYDQGDQKGKGKDVGYNDNRNKKDDNRFYDRYSFSKRERDMKIAEINREYDYKIQSVKSRMFMNRSRKERLICELEDQRKYEIKKVFAKFNDRHNNRDDDHDSWRW